MPRSNTNTPVWWHAYPPTSRAPRQPATTAAAANTSLPTIDTEIPTAALSLLDLTSPSHQYSNPDTRNPGRYAHIDPSRTISPSATSSPIAIPPSIHSGGSTRGESLFADFSGIHIYDDDDDVPASASGTSAYAPQGYPSRQAHHPAPRQEYEAATASSVYSQGSDNIPLRELIRRRRRGKLRVVNADSDGGSGTDLSEEYGHALPEEPDSARERRFFAEGDGGEEARRVREKWSFERGQADDISVSADVQRPRAGASVASGSALARRPARRVRGYPGVSERQ